MADIKITGVDDPDSGETTSPYGGPKVIYNISEQPSADWQSEFNKLRVQNSVLAGSVQQVQFSGTRMTVLCRSDIDPDALKQGIEEVVKQANEKIDTFHKKREGEKF